MNVKASIVIPNWNGRALLERNLPSVLSASEGCEVIVVDDASTDGSAEFLGEHFPAVQVIRHDINLGFSAACLTGVRLATGEVVVLLNSDVRPRSDFLAPLLQHFNTTDVFAVGCLSIPSEGADTIKESYKAPCFRRGLLKFESHQSDTSPADAPARRYTLFATGGHCAVRRDLFLQLGGFDELFKPFYCEDLDLCYRAWKRGFRVIYEPDSVVVHEHQGTIGRIFGVSTALSVNRRNRILFVWKNITSRRMLWSKHIPAIVLRFLFGVLVLDFSFYAALAAALRRLPRTLERRRVERRAVTVTDEEVFRRIAGPMQQDPQPREPAWPA